MAKIRSFQLTDRHLRKALTAAAELDADVAAALERFGVPAARQREHGFLALLRIVVGQQLSVKAAETIYGRLMGALGEGQENPERLLRLGEPTLRGAGLSGAKVKYARALASAVCEGDLDIEGLPAMDDARVVEQLTSIKGLGMWSAQMYLMFCLGRSDIWPAGDLGVRAGLQIIKGLEGRPTPVVTETLVAHLAPHRSAIALLCWTAANAPPNLE